MYKFILPLCFLFTSIQSQEIQIILDKIKSRGDLPYITVTKQLEIAEQLTEFDLGRSLIELGGLTGFWTNYIVTHPMNPHTPKNKVEDFILNRAPVCLATQERFQIFRQQIQARLVNGMSLASIPSGVMGDLLTLDYSNLSDFTLTGVDLDTKSIMEANRTSKKNGLNHHCRFYTQNAWELNIQEKFDLITSNGLAIYEPDNNRVIDLYKQFFNSLKNGGCLITSFLTPPPSAGHANAWDMKQINSQDALLQKVLFADILEAKWQNFVTETTVRAQLFAAGFENIEIIYDKAHIFPTVIAYKPLAETSELISNVPPDYNEPN